MVTVLSLPDHIQAEVDLGIGLQFSMVFHVVTRYCFYPRLLPRIALNFESAGSIATAAPHGIFKPENFR